MNKTTVVCIRHGESLANVFLHEAGKMSDYSAEMTKKIKSAGDDPELSEKGLEQAAQTAKHLQNALREADDTFVMIFTSPMKRVQQTLSQFIAVGEPLHGKKINVDSHMIEYEKTEHGYARLFVKTVVNFFMMLQRKAENACEEQTILLFGHSLFFSVLCHIFSVCRPGITSDELFWLVSKRCCDDGDIFLNIGFHLPNCSVSSFQAVQKDKTVEWKILGIGKTDHLPLSIRTGHHSLF